MTYLIHLAGPITLEYLGVAGALLYMTNYTLLTLGLVNSGHIRYFVLNGTAAGLVLIGLTDQFNLAAAMIQGFFVFVSITGIILRLTYRRPRV